jgi:hypothetical protein
MNQPPVRCADATRDASASSGVLSRSRRWLLATLGVVSVGLAVVGAILPGMPATVFLIIASYCFARSCPWLEERLLRHRIFAPYLPYIRQGAPMPFHARVLALGLMWGSVSISLVGLARTGWRWPASGVALVGAAAAGTVAILLVRRDPSPVAAARPAVSDSAPAGGPTRPPQTSTPSQSAD